MHVAPPVAAKSMVTVASPARVQTTLAAKSAPVTPVHQARSNSVDITYRDGRQRGFFEGLLGCLRPVWSIIGKATQAELKQQGQFEWVIT